MSKLQVARGIVVVIAGVVVFLVIYTILKRPEPSAPPMVITLQPRPTAEPPTPTPATINVYVSGAVQKPDVYALPLSAIVKDAVAAAGGPAADADLDHVNLALRLTDQMQVYVPHQGEAAPKPDPNSPAALSAPININTASAEELDRLPGIGPTLAQNIIDYRATHGPFKTVDALNDVKGIGDALLEKIRGSITTGP